MWKKWAKLAAYTAVGLACAFFLKQLWDHHAEIPPIEWSLGTVFAGVLSLCGTLATVALIALIWKLLLSDQGIKLAYAQALRIIAITQIGKYLPGNVGHFAGRVLLAQKAGVPTGKTLTTIGIETAWTLAISAAFSVAALLFFTQQAHLSDTLQLQPSHLLLAGTFLLFLPFVAIRLLNHFLPSISLKLGHGMLLMPPTLWTAVLVSALMMMCYFILGGVLKLQTQHIFGSSAGSWVQLTMLFTAAWVVGYMLPGAPGGLGVREAMMLALLGPVLGTTVALGVSVTMRLTSMAGDGLAFLVGWLIHPKTP
jgi:uncharacterized membrane protein YbhN (UPF0104 family)